MRFELVQTEEVRMDGGPLILNVKGGTDDVALIYGRQHARLLEAAPDMLDALREVRAVFDLHGAGFLGGKVEKAVRAAIAKAEQPPIKCDEDL